jgi:hypothetical protein
LLLLCTAAAVCLRLGPLPPNVPSAEALMTRIVACEVAVLHEAVLCVPTGEVDFLVHTHRGPSRVCLL